MTHLSLLELDTPLLLGAAVHGDAEVDRRVQGRARRFPLQPQHQHTNRPEPISHPACLTQGECM